jgi:hypothetical protein
VGEPGRCAVAAKGGMSTEGLSCEPRGE